MDILDCCDICGEEHATELCPELGLNTSQVELDVLSTRARLTLPNQFHIADNGNGLVGVVANAPIPAKTQFGPFEAKRTTHIFDDTSFFTLKLICKDGSTICLDTTDENECNWLCLVRAALSSESQNCMAYQLGTNIYFSTTREVAGGEELQVWYAPHFARKLRKPPEPDGETKVLLGHRIEPLVVNLEPEITSHEPKYGQLEEDHHEEEPEESSEPPKMEIIKAFYCPRCGHTFRSQTAMVQHLREHVLASTLKNPIVPGQKRGRGRPRMAPMIVSLEQRGRGRPRKKPESLQSIQRKRKREEMEEKDEEFNLEDLDDDDDENEAPKDTHDSDVDAVIEDTEYSPLRDLTSTGRRIQPKRKRKGENTWLNRDYVVSKIDLKKADGTDELVDEVNNDTIHSHETGQTSADSVTNSATVKVKRGRGRPRKIKELVDNLNINEQSSENLAKQTETALEVDNDSIAVLNAGESSFKTNIGSQRETSTHLNDVVANKTGNESSNSIVTAMTNATVGDTADDVSVPTEAIGEEQEIHVEFINQQEMSSGLPLNSEAIVEYHHNETDESLNERVHVVIHTVATEQDKNVDSVTETEEKPYTSEVECNKDLSAYEFHRHLDPCHTQPSTSIVNYTEDGNTFVVQSESSMSKDSDNSTELETNDTNNLNDEIEVDRNGVIVNGLVSKNMESLVAASATIENSTLYSGSESNEIIAGNEEGKFSETFAITQTGGDNATTVENVINQNSENNSEIVEELCETGEITEENRVGNYKDEIAVVGNIIESNREEEDLDEDSDVNQLHERNDNGEGRILGQNNEDEMVNLTDDINEDGMNSLIEENNKDGMANITTETDENGIANKIDESNGDEVYDLNDEIKETNSMVVNDNEAITMGTTNNIRSTLSQHGPDSVGYHDDRETLTAVEEIKDTGKQEVMKVLEQAGTEVYGCMLCGEKFQTEGDALSHFMNQSCRTDKTHGTTQGGANSSEGLDTQTDSRNKNKDKTKQYSCDICHQEFSTPQYLYRHMVMHTDMFTCVKCKKTFSRKDSLQKHVLKCCPQLADNYRIYACKTCSRVFSTSSGYKKHIKKCGSVQCDVCMKIFNTQADIEQHKCNKVNDSSLAGRFSCVMCPKTFQSQYYLKQHMQLHDNLHTCTHCGKNLPTKEELDNHVMLCQTIQDIKTNGSGNCEKCDETFINVKVFREHYLSHSHPYKCDMCLRRFVKVGTLSSHDCQAEVGNHVCKVCNKYFRSALNLSRHTQEQGCSRYECSTCKKQFYKKSLAINHECSEAVDGQVQIIAKTDRHEICMKCGKSFTTKSNLTKHMWIHGDKKFQCVHCGKQFHLKVYLKEHIACVHYNLYQYQCNHCGKMLRSKTGLTTHNKLLHSDNAEIFPCTECDKTFKQKVNLKQHMISHSSARNYSCKQCLKTFKYPDQLSRHRFEHKDFKKLPCPKEMCEKSFYRQCELKKHIEIYHSGYVYVCDLCEARCSHRHTVIRHYKRKHPHKYHLLSQEGYVDKLYKHYNDLYPDDIITDGIVMQTPEDTVEADQKLTISTEALSHTAAEALHSMALANVTDPKQVLHQQEVGLVPGLIPNIPAVSVEAGTLVPNHDNTITINNLQAIMPTVEGMDTAEGQIVILQIVDPEGHDISTMVPGEIIQHLQVQSGDFIQSIQGLSNHNIQSVNDSQVITVSENNLTESEIGNDGLEKSNESHLEQSQGQVVDIQLPMATHEQRIEISGDLEMQNLLKKEMSVSQTNGSEEQTEVSLIQQENILNIQDIGAVDG